VTATVLTEMMKYSLADYYKEKLLERYFIFMRVSAEKIMVWQKNEISKPLTKLPIEYHGLALQIFKSKLNILRKKLFP
jgi:hypothetical protein